MFLHGIFSNTAVEDCVDVGAERGVLRVGEQWGFEPRLEREPECPLELLGLRLLDSRELVALHSGGLRRVVEVLLGVTELMGQRIYHVGETMLGVDD